MDLKDKVFIVTGATSGIVSGVAKLFARKGARLILDGMDKKKGMFLFEELKPLGSGVFFCPAMCGATLS